MTRLSEHFAIVTGAGGGIGRAISRALAAEGACVWAVGRTRQSLDDTTGGDTRIRARVADLTDDAQVATLIEDAAGSFDRIDVLVHSAGVIAHGAIQDSPVESLDAQYRANVRLPYVVSRSALRLLRKGPGQIVFVNSSIVSGGPRPNVSQFAATQQAVRAIADTLRQEVNADGIRVCCIYPGRTATSRQARLYQGEGREYRPELLLQPEEIATMVISALTLPRTAEVTDIYLRPILKSY